MGYKVTVISGSRFGTSEHLGFTLIGTGTTYAQKMNFWARIFSFTDYAFKSFFIIKSNLKNDKDLWVWASSTPLLVLVPLRLLWLMGKKTKFVFEIRDPWPLIPAELGLLPWYLHKPSNMLERWGLKNAHAVVCLAPSTMDNISKFTIKKPIFVPNFCNRNTFSTKTNTPNYNPLNVIYFGSLGLINNYKKIAEIVFSINKNFDTHIYICAQGTHVSLLINEIKNMGIKLTVLPFSDKTILANLLPKMDFSIVSFADYSSLAHTSPNKFFDSVSARVPVIVNTSGWIADLVKKTKCGICHSDLETELQFLKKEPSRYTLYQEGCDWVYSEFNQEKILNNLNFIFD